MVHYKRYSLWRSSVISRCCKIKGTPCILKVGAGTLLGAVGHFSVFSICSMTIHVDVEHPVWKQWLNYPVLYSNSRYIFGFCFPGNLYLYKYENVCLSVCLFVHVFLGHFETDWETPWHEVSIWTRKETKTIKFQKELFFAELLPFFYISLRFLCKFEERL